VKQASSRERVQIVRIRNVSSRHTFGEEPINLVQIQQFTMDRKTNTTHRSSVLAIWLLALALASTSVLAEEDVDTTDYTCDARVDYQDPKIPGTCPTEKIQNGVCDNPNHGGDDDSCLEQDCIDCNFHCQQFAADCFGCLNAKGCYYCPGDATCQNSDLYQSSVTKLSCTAPPDYWLGGRDDPNKLCIPAESLTTDPLALTNDWVYKMINVDKVWNEGITGNGVTIRINDLGVDPGNTDFEGRFDEANSCQNYLPTEYTDGSLDDHGTRVAGVAIANANNGHCAAGIAYEARFTSCNVLALSYQEFNTKIESIDISQNSIQIDPCVPGSGVQTLEECPFNAEADPFNDPCDPDTCDFAKAGTTSLSADCENAIIRHCKANYRDDESACLDFLDVLLFGGSCDYDKLPKSAIDALAEGVTQGREGKGIVYVFSSGNSFYTGEDVNYSKWPNSRYTITVGAVGKDGFHADYSTPGAALHVVGPAGDSNDAGHIMTTGLGNTCRNSGQGTSFSSPVVSGVIALMLEVRPELTWRDVQGILVETSTVKTDPKDNTKKLNAAGNTHSNWYGFGLIDAKKAVDLAKTWELWTPEYQAIGESEEENVAIPNDGTEYVSQLTMSSDYQGFAAESTVVMINLQHYNRGDLELTLVSPGGTESILHPGRRLENTQLEGDERWKLMTVRNWGEDPTGTWSLKIKDLETDNTVTTGANELRQWKLVVYGRTLDGLPPVLTVLSESPSQTPTTGPTRPVTLAPSLNITDADPSNFDTNTTDAPTGVGDTKSPTDSPSIAPTGTPTANPSSSPTLTPTLTPGRQTLPPLLMVRPTVLVQGATPQETIPVAVAETPMTTVPAPRGTLPQFSSQTVPVDPPGLSGTLGGRVNRPVFVVTREQASTQEVVANFQKFGDDETEQESSQQFLTVELVPNLSIIFWGISEDIPEDHWEPLQIALQDHIMDVVQRKMPELHFWAEVILADVTVNELAPHVRGRSLQPDGALTPSVTISYDVLVHFDHLPGQEGLKGTTLAALPFENPEDRDAFVMRIHDQHKHLERENPWLQSLVGVSDLTVHPNDDYDSVPSTSNISTIIVWSVGVGLLCISLVVIFQRRRKIYGKREAAALSTTI